MPLDPTAAFYQNLQASGLLTATQLRELFGWIAHKKPDIKALAVELNRRAWLTPFQIKEIAKARVRRIEGRGPVRPAGHSRRGRNGPRVYKAHDTSAWAGTSRSR